MLDIGTGSDGLDPTTALRGWVASTLEANLPERDITEQIVITWLQADITTYAAAIPSFSDESAINEAACRYMNFLIANLDVYNQEEGNGNRYKYAYESEGDPFDGAYQYTLHLTHIDLQFTRDGDTDKMSCEVPRK
jgi:hypothetical protein